MAMNRCGSGKVGLRPTITVITLLFAIFFLSSQQTKWIVTAFSQKHQHLFKQHGFFGRIKHPSLTPSSVKFFTSTPQKQFNLIVNEKLLNPSYKWLLGRRLEGSRNAIDIDFDSLDEEENAREDVDDFNPMDLLDGTDLKDEDINLDEEENTIEYYRHLKPLPPTPELMTKDFLTRTSSIFHMITYGNNSDDDSLKKKLHKDEIEELNETKDRGSSLLNANMIETWQTSLYEFIRDIRRCKLKPVLLTVYRHLLSIYTLRSLDALQIRTFEEIASSIIKVLLGLVPSDEPITGMMDDITECHLQHVETMHQILVLKQLNTSGSSSSSSLEDSEENVKVLNENMKRLVIVILYVLLCYM